MSIELAKKRARGFFNYYNLTLPVNIERILEKYAIVEEDVLPSGADAICINKNSKPHIIVKSNISTLRKRFTYAHELAHLQIPSHTGMISCNTDFDINIDQSVYYNMEAEANAFAAELLMPQEWLIEQIRLFDSIDNLLNSICDQACVSYMAALFNVIPLLNENYMFYLTNKINNYRHLKFAGNCIWPLLLTSQDGHYDKDWILLNTASKENIGNGAIEAQVFILKKIISNKNVHKIVSYFTDKKNCDFIAKKIVSENNISYAHLFRDLKYNLPRGFIIKVSCNSSKSYKYIFSSETYISPRFDNEFEKFEWLNYNSDYSSHSEGKNICLDIWYFNTIFNYENDISDKRDSKTILRNIIDNYYSDKKERTSIFAKINGVIGSLNSTKIKPTENEFFNILKQKFYAREDLIFITEHKDFNQFLVKKTKELYKK